MRSLLSKLVVGAVLLATGLSIDVVGAPPSFACDIADPFVITDEHLTSDDFGQPDSQMVAELREFMQDDQAMMPELLGAYVVETVHVEPAQEGWNQGGVDAVVKVWGAPPDDLGPFLNASRDLAKATNGSCDFPSDSTLGRSVYRLVEQSGSGDVWLQLEARDAALTAAFGESKVVLRNTGAEEALIGELKNSRSAPGPGVAIAFGAIVVIGGVLSYWYREKKVHTAWAEVLAERAAAEEARRPSSPGRR